MYQNPDKLGLYNGYENVRETAVPTPTKLAWDQIAVRRIVKAEKPDIVFNPKYSLPLAIDCPGVFVCHGLDWYVMPWGSKWLDRLSHKHLMPRYAKKAAGILSVSDTTRAHVLQYWDVEESRVRTVYHGVDDIFKQEVPEQAKQKVRDLYNLPDSFFLFVSRIYPPKNFGRLLQAYAKTGPRQKRSLVVAGTHTEGCEHELALIESLGIEKWVVWPGWIEQEHLPAFYALADAMVLPSLYESFGIPLVEAMSVGCPVLTADRFGTAEITQNASVLVNPESVESIVDGMNRIIGDPELRNRIIDAGYRRSRDFTWEKCADGTIGFLQETVARAGARTLRGRDR